ncbi:MAG: tetratricopeptide repeat protein, partial [Planctomycetota bacterium]
MVSFHLGRALISVGRGDAAAEALERAIERKPSRRDALAVFSELGRLYGRQQQTELALDVWNRLEKTFPGDTRVGEQIARTLAQEGQNQAALERYNVLVKQTSSAGSAQSIGYRIAAAELKRKLGLGEEALADLESILEKLRPSSWLYADVRRRIEAGFLRSGDYAALADYYAKQVESQPDEIELRLRLGQTQNKAGLLVDAEKTLRDAVALAPSNVEPRLAYIDLLQTSGKLDDAGEQLRALVQLQPDNPDYRIRLGNVLLDDTSKDREVRRSEAAEVWSRLAQKRSDDPVMLAQVGDLMRRIDRSEDALELYRDAIELAPNQPQYREYLGEYLHRLDRKEEAIAAWYEIASGERATRENWIRLAEVLNSFGRSDEAIDAFFKAADQDLTFAERLRFVELLSQAERYDDALSQLEPAEALAENPEQRAQWLQSQIAVFASSGKLDEKIVEAAASAESSQSADGYRRHAMMLNAASRGAEAIAAIERALELEPKDVGSLELAGDLYRRNSRMAKAIEVYRSLAKIETRFLGNYLKRIASLHLELGQVDEAMAVAEELIASAPANPESYRFYAEQSFRVGRDDEGIEKLRLALRAAPRDVAVRKALASALSDRFRTDEAIELYWAILEDSKELSEMRSLIGSLAPLYSRKGDFDRLITRLESLGRERSDTRTATILIAAAHREMDDYGSASDAIETLLAESPRDAELIADMVSLYEDADDLETALEYQTRLTKLADTPENRNRSLRLLVNSGQVARAEAKLRQLQSVTDPLTMISLIDRTLAKQDFESAGRFCQVALEQQPDLWEVRTRLIIVLCANKEFDRAAAEIKNVQSITLADNTQSEVAKDAAAKLKNRRKPPRTQTLNEANDVYYYTQRLSTLSRLTQLLKMGRYAPSSGISYSFGSSYRSPLPVDDVGHAKLIATAMELVIAMKQDRIEEFLKSENLDDFAWVAQSEDATKLRRAHWLNTFYGLASQNRGREVVTSASANWEDAFAWQFAKFSPAGAAIWITRVLRTRTPKVVAAVRKGNEKEDDETNGDSVEPLSEEKLDAIADTIDWLKSPASKSLSSSWVSTNVNQLTVALIPEFKLAGQLDRAKSLRSSIKFDTDSPEAASRSIGLATQLADEEQTRTLIDQVLKSIPTWTKQADASDLSSCSRTLNQTGRYAWIEDSQRLSIGDAVVAIEAITQSKRKASRRSSSRSSTGTVSTYNNANGYKRFELQIPLAADRLPSTIPTAFAQIGLLNADSDCRDQLVSHLQDGDQVFQEDAKLREIERELRQVAATYARWWTGDVAGTYDAVVKLSEAAPEDDVWWIERARLAAELKMPKESLQALDSINPLDQRTLRVRELAAMNLASQLGDLERAKLAAQRLFGMRLDSQTELALSDQLTRLGMREMASALLQRSRRRGGQSVSSLLSLADRYKAANDNVAAAEVAFAAIRKMSRGGERNEAYYRQRAVAFLKTAGRLEPLLQQAKQRSESSPDSVALRMNLAQLYTAAGKSKEADEVFAKVAEMEPDNPRTLWATAERLAANNKQEEAAIKYAMAAVKDPSVLSNGYYRLSNALSQSDEKEKVYEILCDLDISSVRSYYLTNAVRVSGRSEDEIGEFERKFIAKLLDGLDSSGSTQLLINLANNPSLRSSEILANAVRKILTADVTYQTGGWQSTSYSSDGRITGIVQSCTQVLKSNEELRKTIFDELDNR